jgi:hypothetical protein
MTSRRPGEGLPTVVQFDRYVTLVVGQPCRKQVGIAAEHGRFVFGDDPSVVPGWAKNN